LGLTKNYLFSLMIRVNFIFFSSLTLHSSHDYGVVIFLNLFFFLFSGFCSSSSFSLSL